MNFSQIKSFIAAAECENFTRASERLYISQSVLSRQISSIEDELGIKLFVREKKTVRLTPAGEILFDGFIQIMREYSALVENALEMQKGNANRLSIGFVEGQLFSSPFAAACHAFRVANPDIYMSLKYYSIRALKEALLHKEIDVALVAKFKNIDAESKLEYLVVGETPQVMVVPIDNPLAAKKSLCVEDLRGETILTLASTESLVETMDLSTFLSGIDHKEVIVPDIGAFALSIEAGYGISLINNNHSLRNNPNLCFIPIEGSTAFIETVVWHRNNNNPAIKILTNEFRTYRNDEYFA